MHSSHSRRSSRTWNPRPHKLFICRPWASQVHTDLFFIYSIFLWRSSDLVLETANWVCWSLSMEVQMESNLLSENVVKPSLEVLREQLGKKDTFIQAASSLHSMLLIVYLPSSPALRELINNSKLNWLILVVLIRCVQNIHIITPMPLFSCEILWSTYLLYVLCLATDLRSHILRFNCSTNETYVSCIVASWFETLWRCRTFGHGNFGKEEFASLNC